MILKINLSKFDVQTQEEITDYLATLTNGDFKVTPNPIVSLRHWVNYVRIKEDFEPTHIDLGKGQELLINGEIQDFRLTCDPMQKTLLEDYKN